MVAVVFFLLVAIIISYIDAKKEVIPDKIILPSIALMLMIKWLETSLELSDLAAMGIVIIIFFAPLVLDMAFGGGDLRFGAFCALFVGLKGVGFFIIFSGIIHLVILGMMRKKSFGFAPAMSVGALGSFLLGVL